MQQKKKKKKREIREKKTEINNRLINYRIIRDIRTLFEQKENFDNNNYIEYESNSDRNRNLWLNEYPKKIKSYLSNIKFIFKILIHVNSVKNFN